MTADPQVVVLGLCGFDLPHSLEEWAAFDAPEPLTLTRAWRDGQCWAIDGSACVSRPDRAWGTELRFCQPSSPGDRIRERSGCPPPRHAHAKDQRSHSLLSEEVRIVRLRPEPLHQKADAEGDTISLGSEPIRRVVD